MTELVKEDPCGIGQENTRADELAHLAIKNSNNRFEI